jgi:hypothetical protein
MGGIAGPAKRGADKEGREAERISGLQVVKAARAAFSSTACKARKR